MEMDSAHKYLFYLFNKENNSIEGYMYSFGRFVNIWTLNFSENEKLIAIDDPYNSESG